MKLRILHIITSLRPDGAQQMLYKVIANSDRNHFEWQILNLSEAHEMNSRFAELGVPVTNLNLKNWRQLLRGLRSLRQVIKEFQPQILQGWMYHANLVALLAGKLFQRNSSVIWNIRRGLYNSTKDKLLTRLTIRLGAYLSKFTKAIIYCAEICALQHEAIGFDPTKRLVIHNGFNIDLFTPNGEKRDRFRRELRVSDSEILVGIAGRYHPQKDFPNFINAAATLNQAISGIRLVMAGRNVDAENRELQSLLAAKNLLNRTILLGQCREMDCFYAALDLYCLSSSTEGFPNVVGEAMASGVPCVVTDAGGAGDIVHGLGEVVPRCNSAALGEALIRTAGLDRETRIDLGKQSRQRIVDNFSIAAIARKYEDAYRSFVLI